MGAPTTIGLPDWSARLINELDAADQHAKELVSPLTVKQLNWQSVGGAWSVGQCLEHLCIANELYVPAISAALAGKSAASVQEITPGWLSRWFSRSYIEPSPRTKRAAAPKKIVPGPRVELSVLDRFLSSNQAVREVVRRAGAHNVNRIRFKNPFIPAIRFTVGTGLQIICSHERRHLLQAERVQGSANFPV
jgi:hypothetical protein